MIQSFEDKNYIAEPGTCNPQKSEGRSSSAFEATTNRQYYDENQDNQDRQHYQLYFHVLPPHFPLYLAPLLPENLCLGQHNKGYVHWSTKRRQQQ